MHEAAILRDGEPTIKIKFAILRGGGALGAKRKIVQNAVFHGKSHDSQILKLQILSSRIFVVIAQAPRYHMPCDTFSLIWSDSYDLLNATCLSPVQTTALRHCQGH